MEPDISPQQQPVQTPPQVEPRKKRMSWKIVVPVAVLIVVIIIGSKFYPNSLCGQVSGSVFASVDLLAGGEVLLESGGTTTGKDRWILDFSKEGGKELSFWYTDIVETSPYTCTESHGNSIVIKWGDELINSSYDISTQRLTWEEKEYVKTKDFETAASLQ